MVSQSSNPPASSSAGTTRKSRPLRRKTSHSVIERRRREKINEGLITLQATVPACREELQALLLVKARSDRRNARKTVEEITDGVEATMKEKIEQTMMLEKLCIISHTVDYVNELQRVVQSYRDTYGCEPAEVMARSQIEGANEHAKVHSEVMHSDADESEGGESGTAGAMQSPSPNSSTEAKVEPCGRCDTAACRAKRQRHWGSNNPMHIDRIVGQKRRRTGDEPGNQLHSSGERSNPYDESDDEGFELDDWEDRQCMRRHDRNDVLHAQPTLLYASTEEDRKSCLNCNSAVTSGDTLFGPSLPSRTRPSGDAQKAALGKERDRRLSLLASVRLTGSK